MAIRLREQEFGPEVEGCFREVFHKIRSAVQDLCYSYRDDPAYHTVTAPYWAFATATDYLLKQILYALDAATKKVLVLGIVDEIEKVAQDLPTFGPTLRGLVDQLTPAVAELGPPSDYIAKIRTQSAESATAQQRCELESTIWDMAVWLKKSGKPADVDLVTSLQTVAIQWLAVRDIQEQAGPNYTGRIKTFVSEKPALTEIQRQTRLLRDGPLAAVDRELREARGKLIPLKESAEHKRSQIKEVQTNAIHCDTQIRDLHARTAAEMDVGERRLRSLREEAQDKEAKLSEVYRHAKRALKGEGGESE
jgi:hypothetical protein